MKQIFTSTLITLLAFASGFTQNTYTINSNTSWQSTYNSSYTSNASFVIAAGKTLTLDQAWATAANCTFSGGTIAITQNFTCQGCTFSNCKLTISNSSLSLQSNTTSFTNVTGTVTGTGSITGSAPVTFTSSVFTFSGTSSFNPQQQLDLYSSTLNFLGNSFLLSTGGPDNLWGASSIVAGDGTTTSKAFLYFNGAALNLESATAYFALAAASNYFFDWSSYNSVSNNKSYAGNRDTRPYTYGPATGNANGISAGYTAASLPVVLTDFTAVLSAANAIGISWRTQQETNSASFTIERSADGIQWQPIAVIAAKGNSSLVSDYAYTDQSPLSGVDYYRLKMTDLDGASTYSEVAVVRTGVVTSISVFPNPAVSYVNITLASPAAAGMSIRLINMSGQIVLNQQVSAGTSGIVTLAVQSVTRGMYVVNIIASGALQQSTKMFINH